MRQEQQKALKSKDSDWHFEFIARLDQKLLLRSFLISIEVMFRKCLLVSRRHTQSSLAPLPA